MTGNAILSKNLYGDHMVVACVAR